MLTFNRTESRDIELALEATDLITFVMHVVEEFQLAFSRTHRIDFVCNMRRLQASIDRKLIRRVLTNLITNALKYTPEGGRVSISLVMDGDTCWQVSVQDSGIGIPQQDMDSLFQPFQRASNVGDTHGSGLGLAIVSQIVAMHQGARRCAEPGRRGHDVHRQRALCTTTGCTELSSQPA